MTSVVRWGTLALILLSAVGCGRDPVGVGSGAQPGELRFDPSRLELVVGQAFAVDVLQVQSDGRLVSVLGDSGLWLTSSDPSVLALGADGRGVAIAPGTVTLVAQLGFRRVEATAEISARDPDGEFVGLRVEPAQVVVPFGESRRVRVFATRSTGEDVDVTSQAQFSDPFPFATIDPDGLVTALDGNFSTTLDIGVSFEGLFTAFLLTVTPDIDSLIFVDVVPGQLFLPVGGVGQLQVIGEFANGEVADLTLASSGTTYASAIPDVVEVTPDGQVRVIAPFSGPVPIFVSNGGFEAVAIVVIVEPMMPVALFVSPDPVVVAVGEAVPLQVIATFADGSVPRRLVR